MTAESAASVVEPVPVGTMPVVQPLHRPASSWRLLALALTLPGLQQWRTGRTGPAVVAIGSILAATATAGLCVPWASGWRSALVQPTTPLVLLVASTLVSLALVVSVATAGARPAPTWLAFPVAALPLVAAAWVALPAMEVHRRTFVTAPVAAPSPLVPPVTLPGPRPVSPPPPASDTTRPSSTTLPPSVTAGRVNILLIGGDAGPGRYGLRADSLNVVSVDPAGGSTVIVGIPRNLYGATLPPGPLRDRFPEGFPDLLNAIYPWATAHRDEVTAALGSTGDVGASLTAAVVAEVTGLRLDGWVLVDMAGFVEIVDALGGVEVYVSSPVPAPGNIPSAKQPLPEVFGPGWQQMDGTWALGYVRSRSADSDYARMARQRCVLLSLAAQHGTGLLVARWPALAATVADTVRTNLSPGQLVDLVGLAAAGPGVARSVALTPPAVPARGWHPSAVRALVAEAFTTATSPNTPAETPPAPATELAPLSTVAVPEPGCVPRR